MSEAVVLKLLLFLSTVASTVQGDQITYICNVNQYPDADTGRCLPCEPLCNDKDMCWSLCPAFYVQKYGDNSNEFGLYFIIVMSVIVTLLGIFCTVLGVVVYRLYKRVNKLESEEEMNLLKYKENNNTVQLQTNRNETGMFAKTFNNKDEKNRQILKRNEDRNQLTSTPVMQRIHHGSDRQSSVHGEGSSSFNQTNISPESRARRGEDGYGPTPFCEARCEQKAAEIERRTNRTNAY